MKKITLYIVIVASSALCAYLAWMILGVRQPVGKLEFISHAFALISFATMLNAIAVAAVKNIK